ncbi:hypothetical protein N9K36_00690 [Candidatus Pelagibacter bacterium]|jgi:hypothetical protein|nr:hypothetical protein [Candidatus Pelagibacter bacterium]
MKIFIYKLLITLVAIYILFQLTFGLIIKEFNIKISEITSSENIVIIKEKIRKEIKSGIKKDQIMSQEDSRLLKEFFNKIKNEINNVE